MRRTSSIILLSLFILMPAAIALHAQEKKIERSPADSLKCLELFSVYSLALEKKMYDYAIGPWRYMLENCPDAGTRLYSDGADLLGYYIDKESEETKREALIDTLLMVYDKRAEWFGSHEKYPEGWIWGRKGLEIVKYRRNNPDALQEAYRLFEKSYRLLQNRAEAPVMLAWMQTSRSLYMKNRLPADSLLNNFFRINNLITAQLEDSKSPAKKAVYEKVLKATQSIITHSGVTDCAMLAGYLEEGKPIEELTQAEIKRYISLLEMARCLDSEIYTVLVEKDYQTAPDPGAAIRLARMFVKQQRYNDARVYYLEALGNHALEDTLEAIGSYELAVLLNGHFNEPRKARNYARRAAAANPSWGAPYMLLGSIYAGEAANFSGDEFEKQALYWAAVDQFSLAAQVDNTFSDEANKQIATYSRYFPDQQTVFFKGLEEGQSYMVEGWVNENTVVRYKK